jgi:hypothetical protein
VQSGEKDTKVSLVVYSFGYFDCVVGAGGGVGYFHT